MVAQVQLFFFTLLLFTPRSFSVQFTIVQLYTILFLLTLKHKNTYVRVQSFLIRLKYITSVYVLFLNFPYLLKVNFG